MSFGKEAADGLKMRNFTLLFTDHLLGFSTLPYS
jgi:hypothetical protein